MNETPATTPVKKRPDIVVWSVVIGMLVLVIAIILPGFLKARNISSASSCINHMRQIDSAIQQWALETGQADTNSIDARAIGAYIKGGKLLTCPNGGRYTLAATVGTVPPVTCSLSESGPGHVLP